MLTTLTSEEAARRQECRNRVENGLGRRVGGQRENSSLDSNYGLLRCAGAVALCAVAGEGITKQDGDVDVALQRICRGFHKSRRAQ